MAGELTIYSTTTAITSKHSTGFQQGAPGHQGELDPGLNGHHACAPYGGKGQSACTCCSQWRNQHADHGQAGHVRTVYPQGCGEAATYRDARPRPLHRYLRLPVVCFNTIEAEKNNLPRQPSGRTSPIRYTATSRCPTRHRLAQAFLTFPVDVISNEEKAWSYMDKLHENIATYTLRLDPQTGRKRRVHRRNLLALPWRKAEVQGRTDRHYRA